MHTLDGSSSALPEASRQENPLQGPAHNQMHVAHALGIPGHKVVGKTKRLGGGFGGKETRAVNVSCAAAVPAYHLRRPVRLILDRDEDMHTSGHRHAYIGKYKVGVPPPACASPCF